jgi:SAM-dependent methyltransferase
MGDRFPRPSFRDPEGRTVVAEDRVLRYLRPGALTVLGEIEASASARELLASGAIISWQPANGDQTAPPDGGKWAAVIAHRRIPFASYPHEWPPEMLAAAGRLTLRIATALLADGFGLKDATPYNVLFDGPRPIHVDVLSMERRRPGDPLWLAEAQFQRTFVLPLLACRTLGQPVHLPFLAARDGLEPESLYRAVGPLRRLSPGFFGMVTLPVWLAGSAARRREGLYRGRRTDAERAAFILRHRLGWLVRRLERALPEAANSAWSDYEETRNYSAADLTAKDAFVQAALRRFTPASVLDVGCNTGRYSLMAAAAGARVVAVDSDPVVAGRLWSEASARGAEILPLVVDLARPTPALGWRNGECPSFLARAEGGFDAVLALAILHHLLVTHGIPLAEIIGLLARLTTKLVVVEFVSPEDANFRRLYRGREDLHAGLTEEAFARACETRFSILDRRPLQSGTRSMFLLQVKAK